MLLKWLPSFLLSAFLTRLFVQLGRRFQLSQPISEFVNHKHKSGTPTFGGIAVFLSFMLLRMLNSALGLNREMQHIYYVGTVCFLVGLIDDFTKVRTKHNKGKTRLWKLSLLILFLLPYFMRFAAPLEAIQKTAIIIFASATADILDGLDGLLCMTAIPILCGLGNGPSISLAGSLLGFLCFNLKPAKIFLGDCGAMFIGSIIGSAIISSNLGLDGVALCALPIFQSFIVLLKMALVELRLPHKFFTAPIHHHVEKQFGETWATLLLVSANALVVVVTVTWSMFVQLRKF